MQSIEEKFLWIMMMLWAVAATVATSKGDTQIALLCFTNGNILLVGINIVNALKKR